MASSSLHPPGRASSMRPSEARSSTSQSRARCWPLAVQERAGRDRPRVATLVRAAARHEEPRAVEGRRDVVGADAERHEDDGGVLDRVQQAGRLVVVGLQQGARRRGGGGQHHRVRLGRPATGPHGPAGPRPLEPVGRRREPDVDAAFPELRHQRPYQRGHAAVEGPEQRRPVGVRCGDLGPQGPHEAASALGRRQQRREDRRRGHVVDRAGVDAADEGVDQRVDDPLPELARHQRPDGAVADRARGRRAGAGRRRGRGRSWPRNPSDTGAGGGPEPGRYPEREPLGQRARRRPRAHTDAPAPRDRDEHVGEPELVAQVDRLGPPAEETVGAHVDGTPTEVVAAQRAAEARRRLEHHDRGRVGAALGAAGQLPGRGQAADASADDDHPPGRHVRAPRRPR